MCTACEQPCLYESSGRVRAQQAALDLKGLVGNAFGALELPLENAADLLRTGRFGQLSARVARPNSMVLSSASLWLDAGRSSCRACWNRITRASVIAGTMVPGQLQNNAYVEALQCCVLSVQHAFLLYCCSIYTCDCMHVGSTTCELVSLILTPTNGCMCGALQQLLAGNKQFSPCPAQDH